MLFKRKEIWVPTWKGWLVFLGTFAAICFGIIRTAAPFLSPHKPLGAPVLVMEGWISEPGLLRVMELANQKQYALVITTGIEIEKGLENSPYGNYANLGLSRLRALGYKGTNLVQVPGLAARKDRTYHAALALHHYLVTNTNYRSIDLFTESVHGRRSWILFSKACAPEIQVGIIGHESKDFDYSRWWRSSQGVRTVLSEMIAYLYAKLIFSPK